MFACCCTAEDTGGSQAVVVDSLPSLDDRGPRVQVEEKEDKAKEEPAAPEVPAAPPPAAPPPKKREEKDEVREKVESFEATVPRGPSGFGIHLDLKPLGLHVIKIAEGGGAQAYNVTAAADKRIEANYFITAVNGKTDSIAMVKEFQDKATTAAATMTVVKPAVFTVQVNKGGGKLGCKLTYNGKGSAYIGVTDILRDGVLKDYPIKDRDCISSVNGVSGDAVAMAKEITDNDKLSLKVVRVEE